MPIAEKDILRMAQKIQQNESENNVFRKQLDKYFRGDMPSHEVINVCSTPNVLKLLKSTAKKVVLNQKDLENAVANSKSGTKSHTEGHDISKEEIYKLSEALRNPIMVLKGNKRSQNSVILITDLTNKKGEKVFVPIALDRQNGRISTISSLYGKKNLSKYISEHTSDILAINKEKVDLFADTRDQYSQSINDTVTYFDDSIAYTTDNVKYPSEKTPEQQAEQQAEQQSEPQQSEQHKEQPDSQKSRNVEFDIHNSFLVPSVQKIELAIAKLEDKINGLESKIKNNETKINTQKSKIEDSQNSLRYYKAMLETAALSKPLQVFVSSMIDRQNTKIANCNAKIARLEARCDSLSDKIAENNLKIEKQTSRLKVFQKIDTFLVNMQSKDGRRENFLQTITDLRNWSLERNKEKAARLETKFTQKDIALSKATTATERVTLRNQLAKIAEKRQEIENKIEKLTAMTDKLNQLSSMSEQQADRVIVTATENINNSIKESSDVVSVTKVVDTVLNEANQSIEFHNSPIQCYSIEQNGVVRFFETTEYLTSNEILNTVFNSDKPFVKLSEMGNQITEERYAEIQQSDKFGTGIDVNFDEDTIQTYKVNHGKGGLAEPDRNEANTSIITSAISDYKQKFASHSSENSLEALCSCIKQTFEQNYNSERRILHTSEVMNTLADKYDFGDVKSAIATAILNRQGEIQDGKISTVAEQWAKQQPVSENLKPFIAELPDLLSDVKSGFLDIFAKKAGVWEEFKQNNKSEKTVVNRKDIAKKTSQQQKPAEKQDKTKQHNKNGQAL